jgi:hypothetical protein
MIKNRQRTLLPAIFLVGSFLCLLATILFTNPLNNLSYTIIFFMSLLIFLISISHIILYLSYEEIPLSSKYKIYTFSFIIVITLMLGSAQSLNLIDFIILLLISWGMVFYISRRVS